MEQPRWTSASHQKHWRRDIAPGILQTAHNTYPPRHSQARDKDILLTLSSSCILDKSGDTSVSQASLSLSCMIEITGELMPRPSSLPPRPMFTFPSAFGRLLKSETSNFSLQARTNRRTCLCSFRNSEGDVCVSLKTLYDRLN